MDKRLDAVRKALVSSKVELEEVGLELRDLKTSVVVDPFRLEEVEERFQLVRRLKRKYGPGLEDILNFKENLSGTIENLEQKERSLETLKDNLRALASDMVSGAAVLSRVRQF